VFKTTWKFRIITTTSTARSLKSQLWFSAWHSFTLRWPCESRRISKWIKRKERDGNEKENNFETGGWLRHSVYKIPT